MIPTSSPCDGCGATVEPVEEFAAVEHDREVEVVLLRCRDCGDSQELVRQVA